MGWGGRNSRWALAVLLACAALFASAPAALAVEGTGKITGTVTEALKTGISQVQVGVFTSNKVFAGVASTDASGKYTVEHLAAGSYMVEFFPVQESGYAPQYYDNELSFSTATPVSVTEGETTTEVNAELHVGGKISGTVTDTGAHPLEHIGVFVFSTGGEIFVAFAETDANGKYTVVGLPTGSYSVEFYPESSMLNFVPQYYDNALLLQEATVLSVVEGTEKTGIDAELQEGGRISGRVTDAYTHKPVAGVYVFAHNVGIEGDFGGSAETNANGEYTVSGLGNGTYRVEFESGFEGGIEYITQYYSDRTNLVGANLVTVTQGSTTPGINAALVPKAPVNTAGPIVSGTATVGQALSCSNGSWTGEPKPTFTHMWMRNGSPIIGASASTYVVQSADQLSGLTCRVTARNAHGTASATSNTLSMPRVPTPLLSLPPRPKPVVTILTSKIVVSHGVARVPIRCAVISCSGGIALGEPIKYAHQGNRYLLGRYSYLASISRYSLASGQRATIIIHLDKRGSKALVRAKHHRLSAIVAISVAGGAPVQKAVVLVEALPKHKRHR